MLPAQANGEPRGQASAVSVAAAIPPRSCSFLNKTKLTIQGRVTNAARLWLRKRESSALLNPAVARISWLLEHERNEERDDEHFGPPFLLAVDRVLNRIRNLKVRELPGGTLFPLICQTSFPTEPGLGRNRSDPLQLINDEIPVALGARHAVRGCARGSTRAILRAMISEAPRQTNQARHWFHCDGPRPRFEALDASLRAAAARRGTMAPFRSREEDGTVVWKDRALTTNPLIEVRDEC